MIARLSAFVIWAVVAAAAAFWGMRLLVHADPAPLNAVVAAESTNTRGDLSRLLGAEPVSAVAIAPEASTRFRLLGVMAAKALPDGATPGFALISIDGKPPRAFAAGAPVEDQLVLQTVSLRSASFGPAQGAPAFTLEIPPLPAPATGILPKVTPESLGAAQPSTMRTPMVTRPPQQPAEQPGNEQQPPMRMPPRKGNSAR